MQVQPKIKVYFASLFGVNLDAELAVPWVNHYKRLDIDYFHIFLHGENYSDPKLKTFELFFKSHGFNVTIINGNSELDQAFQNGKLRKKVLGILNKSIDETDYLVTADSDEFQQIPNTYRESIAGKDCLCGVLVDRYTDKLKKYDPDYTLDTQYPLSGDVQKRVFEIADKRFFHAFCWVSQNKIIAARGKTPVAFGGSHKLYPEYENDYSYSHKDNPIPVYHYRWRENAIQRMQQRNYNRAVHLWYFMQFFNVVKPEENIYFKKQLEYENSIQKKRGWTV